jgi:hypothetical protein
MRPRAEASTEMATWISKGGVLGHEILDPLPLITTHPAREQKQEESARER